jgi:hypothetical protein
VVAYGFEERHAAAMVAEGLEAWYPRQVVWLRRRGERLVPLGRYVFVRAPAPLDPMTWHAAAGVEGFVGWLGGEVPEPVGDAS